MHAPSSFFLCINFFSNLTYTIPLGTRSQQGCNLFCNILTMAGAGAGTGTGTGAGVREQDQYMPIANVIRIMRRILPSHAKISDDAKETIQECVSEFISFITAEANERCQREQRKTVTAEDVLWAMGKLGFDDYVHPLTLYLQRYRESEGEPASGRRSSSTVASASSVAALAMHPPHPLPLPPFSHGFGIFDFDPTQVFYRDDASASASASNPFITNFDPFPHTKRDSL